MAGRLTEEQITKVILKWLSSSGWHILCFDFPQSGTGYILHQNQELRTTKNKGAIIPDIVAIKDKKCVFFENKDRFVLNDFRKIETLRTKSNYNESITKLLFGQGVENIFFGVGLPKQSSVEAKILEHKNLIDFALIVENETKEVTLSASFILLPK
ncbi:MAG: hypothetical protein EAZ32_19820 [Cytophagia bacterium]|nr:MAG: hypothetical protein EAZ38_02445 [Cytophagales bacterium]TAG34329.1 MAG: hypothetical protein EAZ32_19820 [Cytophagia bacterium]TAG76602.1 MAG: hypothetical protein EAZ22_17710 [Cytophagales bacterium]